MYFEIAKNNFKREFPQANQGHQAHHGVEKLKSKLLELIDSKSSSEYVTIMYWRDGTEEFKYVFEKVFGTEILNHLSVELIK